MERPGFWTMRVSWLVEALMPLQPGPWAVLSLVSSRRCLRAAFGRKGPLTTLVLSGPCPPPTSTAAGSRTTLRGRWCCAHFAEEETEAQEGAVPFPGYTVMLEQRRRFKRVEGRDLLLQRGDHSPTEGKTLAGPTHGNHVLTLAQCPLCCSVPSCRMDAVLGGWASDHREEAPLQA